MDLWEPERACWAEGAALVCGVDEAGAGPLAGAVYAAAVILPPEWKLEGLNDSKQVSPKRRERLFDRIREQASAWAVAWADEREIDETDILRACPGRRLCPDRRKPGSRQGGGDHHAPPRDCKGRQPVGLHRCGLDPGQGQPGPLHGGDGPALSGI